jgi:hypothetical protein
VLERATENGYTQVAGNQAGDEETFMPKMIDFTRDEMAEWLTYDAETGKLFWKKKPNNRTVVGSEAGTIKHPNPKSENRYRYITMHGVSTPSARVVWLMHNGEWPSAPIKYKNEDSLDTRIANLEMARFPTRKAMEGGRVVYKMSKEAMRHYGLKRYYGLTGEQYGEMLAAQKGLCAICNQPETAMINGLPKVMHVDHDHVTGQIRSLLCGSCNGALGLFKDDPARLRAAADYIEKHRESNVVTLGTFKSPPLTGE